MSGKASSVVAKQEVVIRTVWNSGKMGRGRRERHWRQNKQSVGRSEDLVIALKLFSQCSLVSLSPTG